ncbi:hypothetical protein GOODEAATRI_023278 [Goodea atripinnis]|uniref:Ig-like domain-containing protein n=1 Tax=Goodea atripinnis TaxID=208336 RepID=A0ABV0MN32_9TELE
MFHTKSYDSNDDTFSWKTPQFRLTFFPDTKGASIAGRFRHVTCHWRHWTLLCSDCPINNQSDVTNQDTTSYLNMKKCSNKDSLKMILLWVTLLLSHQGYALVPVITVHLGETVTFRCDLPKIKDRNGKLYWYRQTAGDTLEIVAKFVNHANPDYGPGFSDSRVKTVLTDKMSNLTILKTVQQDEGMYHCAFTDWTRNVWHGNYLLIKGNTVGTSNQRVVQRLMVSDSVRPEDSVTLQCSVLSDFENKTCSGDLSVFCYKTKN